MYGQRFRTERVLYGAKSRLKDPHLLFQVVSAR